MSDSLPKVTLIYSNYFDAYLSHPMGPMYNGYIDLFKVERLNDNDEYVRYYEVHLYTKDVFHHGDGNFVDYTCYFYLTKDCVEDEKALYEVMDESYFVSVPKDVGGLSKWDVEYALDVFGVFFKIVNRMLIADKVREQLEFMDLDEEDCDDYSDELDGLYDQARFDVRQAEKERGV